jgi:ElaB/YqjD/DUF883 family membrane-anchored ribosome-binding protein
MDMADPTRSDRTVLSSAEIAAQLDLDRAALAQTIEGLRNRLAPDMLMDDVISKAGATLTPYAQMAERRVRANPLAAILAGAGVAWLVLGRKHTDPTGSAQGDEPGPAPVSDLNAARTEDLHPAHPLDEAAPQAAKLTMGRFVADQPLLAAGIGMAIGVAIGAAMPGTAVEDRLLGPDRDKLLAKARAAVRQQEDQTARTTAAIAATLAASLVSTLAAGWADKLSSDAQKDRA